jgi:hypothetical protein
MRYQPQGLQRIDRRNADVIAAAEIWLPGFGSNGLLYNTASSTKPVGSVNITPAGIGFRATAQGSRYPISGLASNKVAWLIVASRNNSPSNCSVVRKDGAITPLQEWDGKARIATFGSGGGFDAAINYGDISQFANRVSTFCGLLSPSEAAIFSNGGPNISLGGRTLSGGGDSNPFCIGSTENGGEIATNWTVLMVVVWRGTVPTSDRLRNLSSNPWQLFEAPDEDDFLSIPAQQYMLTAESGIFTVASTSAQLAARRRVAAAAAGFALTPLSASIVATRKLTAGAGSMAVVALPARLTAARRLYAAPGAVACNGAAARVIASRKLDAQCGTVALTGATATFVYTSAPGGQGPTYTLTGGCGMFLLSPLAARLLLVRRLVAAVGSFSAAGTAAQLIAARRLQAAPGALAIAGVPAGLRVARRMPAAAGSFSLTGNTATFFYTPIGNPGGPTYTLAAVGGALGLTGTGVGLRARRRMLGGAGQFNVTGWAANLVYGKQIVYARAPAGSGYTPRTTESQHRPTSAATTRPAAIQRNKR